MFLVSCDRLLELGSLAQPTHAPGFSSPQEQASPGRKLPFHKLASSGVEVKQPPRNSKEMDWCGELDYLGRR